jgi:AcrR family transcriptional regulator
MALIHLAQAVAGGDPNRRPPQLLRQLGGATVALLRDRPYPDITTGAVAARAGIPHQTVGVHFTSIDALIAEVYLLQLHEAPFVIDVDAHPRDRVIAFFGQITTLLADEPNFAFACARALMTDDPSVRETRDRIAVELHHRLSAALGFGAWPEVVQTLLLGLTGALTHAGCGAASRGQVIDQLCVLATAVLGAPTSADRSSPQQRHRANPNRTHTPAVTPRLSVVRPDER